MKAERSPRSCKLFYFMGENWTIKWAVKQALGEGNDGYHEKNP
jgi:hypothetical protein